MRWLARYGSTIAVFALAFLAAATLALWSFALLVGAICCLVYAENRRNPY